MAEDHASEQHAYWLHFSVEPLLRATVAHAHPALLADPRSDESLLAALGVGGYEEQTAFRSRPSSALVKLLGALDAQRFGPDFARRINTFIDTRNVESHAEGSPLGSLRAGWRDDFLRVATPLCDFIQVAVASVLGDGLATLSAQLTERDEKAVQAELQRLVAEARSKAISPVARTGVTEVGFADGRVSRAVNCPACGNESYVIGWPIRRSEPVVHKGGLVRRVAVAAQNFACEHCELRLADRPLLVAAGLPDVFETVDVVDPYEALTLDPAEEVERMGLVVVDPDWEPDFDDIGD
jgi:hypothetical protein